MGEMYPHTSQYDVRFWIMFFSFSLSNDYKSNATNLSNIGLFSVSQDFLSCTPLRSEKRIESNRNTKYIVDW